VLDCTFRIQAPHKVGSLAKVAGAIAEAHGVIGDVVTLNVGREASIREITIEVRDNEHAEEVSASLCALGFERERRVLKRWNS
jgi:uncharacterized protein with ACT and thioredoxin-like domain